MRRRLLLFALLSLVCWLLPTNCRITQAGGNGHSNDPTAGWRRTAHGWEKASHWQLNTPPYRVSAPGTGVHPLVIASLELLISVGALVIASAASRKPHR